MMWQNGLIAGSLLLLTFGMFKLMLPTKQDVYEFWEGIIMIVGLICTFWVAVILPFYAVVYTVSFINSLI